MSDSNEELQAEEREVLQSIYDGDENFKLINNRTIQYKLGEEGEKDTVLLEIQWPSDYPEVGPECGLGAFYNNHLSSTAKTALLTALKEECDKNLGTQQTYTLIEWTRENYRTILEQHVTEELSKRTEELRVTGEEEEQTQAKIKVKKEQLSKSQKRKEWDRLDAKGEKPRGWDWVDVIKHLSQTGPKQMDQVQCSSGPASKPYLSAADLPD